MCYARANRRSTGIETKIESHDSGAGYAGQISGAPVGLVVTDNTMELKTGSGSSTAENRTGLPDRLRRVSGSVVSIVINIHYCFRGLVNVSGLKTRVWCSFNCL